MVTGERARNTLIFRASWGIVEKATKPGGGVKKSRKKIKCLVFQDTHAHSLISVSNFTNLRGHVDFSCCHQKDALTYSGALGMTNIIQLFLSCFLLNKADHGWEIVFSHLIEAAEGREDVLLRGQHLHVHSHHQQTTKPAGRAGPPPQTSSYRVLTWGFHSK